MDEEIKTGAEAEKAKNEEIIVPVLEESSFKKLSFLDVLNRLSPGKSLRTALDDILEGESGALIVVDSSELRNIIDGGFRLNTKFTSQKLAELAKMDGAIVLSDDLKRILFANVLLVPDSRIPTHETGTRHKAAERAAKQIGTTAIAVSERRSKITLFHEDKKYILENSENLLRRTTETLHILEKQKEILDEIMKNLNILEITKLVSVADVCSVLQRIEVIVKMHETMKRYLTELGTHGAIVRIRVKELSKGIEELKEAILKDYSSRPQNIRKMLDSLTFDGVIDTEALSRMLFEASPDTPITSKGLRILEKLNLTEREIKLLIGNFESISGVIEASPEEINRVLKSKTESFKKEFDKLKEQILMGKKI